MAQIGAFGENAAMMNGGGDEVPAAYRNKEMAAAVFASKFGASSAVRKFEESNRMLALSKKDDHVKLADRMREYLSKQLMVATDREADLQQQCLEKQANEEVLKERLAYETKQRQDTTKVLKRLQGETAKFKHHSRGAEIKIEGNMKNVTVLQMRIRNLQTRLEEQTDQGKYVIERSHAKNIIVRELESELMTLVAENRSLTDKIERIAEQKVLLEQLTMKFMDTLVKDTAIANVNIVALNHDLTSIGLDHEPLQWRYKDLMDLYAQTEEKMLFNQKENELRKKQLTEELKNEENSNNQLVEEIAQKSMVDSGLLQDMAEEQSAKEMLMSQLDDKHKLCLEIQKRLHGMNQVFTETSNALKNRDGENGDLINMCENLKSSVKVLTAQAKLGNEMSTKLAVWAREERADADRLRIKFDILDDNKSTVKMLEAEDTETKYMLKRKLKDKIAMINGVKSDLYHVMALYDDTKNKFENVQLDAEGYKMKYAKEAARVDKVKRELNLREREFRKKLETHATKEELLDAAVEKADITIVNLQHHKNTTDSEVQRIEEMLDDKAFETEQIRNGYTAQIIKGDERSLDLQTDLRQQLNKNTIIQTDGENSETRIINANKRQFEAVEVSVELKNLNIESAGKLQLQLKEELDKFLANTKAVEKLHVRRAELVAELELTDHGRRSVIMKFRNLKHEDEDAVQKLENGKEELLQRTKMLEGLDQERGRMQSRVDEKELVNAQLVKSLAFNKEKLDDLKKSIALAESAEMDFFSAEEVDKTNIARIERLIRNAESQHVTDGNKVRLKVTQLVGMLELKKETVVKLEIGVARLRHHNDSMEMDCEQTEQEENTKDTSYKRKVDFSRIKNSKYREEIDRITADMSRLQRTELSKNEKVRLYGDKLHENVLNQNNMLSDSYRTNSKFHDSQAHVESLRVNERVMQEETSNLKKDVTQLKFEEHEETAEITELQLEINDIVCQNGHFKAQMRGYAQRENVLLLRVEAERNGIRTSTGHAEADKHAEEALLSLLNQTNADNLGQLSDPVAAHSDLAGVSESGGAANQMVSIGSKNLGVQMQ